jgi:triosephosphate isomerase (TIM)
MASRKPLIAGNWKMFGRRTDLAELETLWGKVSGADQMECLICPPAAYIAQAVYAARATGIVIGAQDCSATAEDSARTGEVSAGMLADVGAKYVILGHSERRAQHGESDALVRQKATAAQKAGLKPIVCVGETRAERDAGQAGAVVARQVRESAPESAGGLVVAYEPVWAIGGDRTPTPAEIAEIHGVVRQTLVSLYGEGANAVRVLYGGSVGTKNAGEVFSAPGVDGALVGRASLKADDFSAIVLAHPLAR